MPRDYRTRTKRRSAATGASVSLVLLGIILGLIGAVVFYSNFYSPPHSKHHHIKPAASSSVAKKADHAQKITASKQPTTTPKSAAIVTATPKFDFYTVLPKMQVEPEKIHSITPAPPHMVMPITSLAPVSSPEPIPTTLPISKTTTITTAHAAAPPEPVLPTNLSPPTSSSDSHYFLQMASKKNFAEIDRLRSRLVAMGLVVTLQNHIVNRENYYQVLMGPYPSRQIALMQQSKLQKKHISSILIKSP